MHLLPLHSLLNIPSEGLTIVVDNAVSPVESVSFRLQSRRRKQLRGSSSDNKHEGDRWSAIPPPPLMAPEYAMASSCDSASFLRVSEAHEMDCTSIGAKNLLQPPVRQTSYSGLVKRDENPLLSQLLQKKTEEKRSVVATRSSSLTLNIPVRKASKDALGKQSTPRRHHSCSSKEPQLNAQWDLSKITTRLQAMKPNPLLLQTSHLPHQEVPAFISQNIHLMSTGELLEMAMAEVTDC